LSIFEKIKAWWTARREAKRDWWLEPIKLRMGWIESEIRDIKAATPGTASYNRQHSNETKREPREFDYEHRQ
jgi:hypothetical protein